MVDPPHPHSPITSSASIGASALNTLDVEISGSAVSLTPAATITSDSTVQLTYSSGNKPVQDLAGNDAAALTDQSIANQSSVDGTALTFISAAPSTDGLSISLAYSEDLSITTTDPADFSVTSGGSSNPITTITISRDSLSFANPILIR